MSDLRERLLERLRHLRPGTTMCPGQLARDCGSTLAAARSTMMALADSNQIIVSQRGKTVAPNSIKGPFRVRLK